jgi:acyl carrier protein
VARVLSEIDDRGHRLGGVMHAAMVLDDSLVLNMTEQHLRNVWGPKVLGAWHLQRLTERRPLDFFVLFSSISAVFGAGGQANYASANTFLDALARHRHARGQPGLSVSWGYLGEVGFVARHGAIAERFETIGVKSFTPNEALSLLSRFLDRDPVHVGVMRVDWRRWRKTAAAVSISPRFAHFVSEGEEASDDGQRKSSPALRAALLGADPSRRREIIEPAIREQVAKVLGASPAKLEVDRPLSDLGLDSLMAVELKNWIEGELGVTLPSVELLRGPSIADLTGKLLEQMAKRDEVESKDVPAELPASAERAEREDAHRMLARIDEMSDEELDAALGEVEPEADATTATSLRPPAG